MKYLFLLGLILVTPNVFAEPNSNSLKKLEVEYRSEAAVEELLSNPGGLFEASTAKIRPSAHGALHLAFNKVFSNRCMAGRAIVTPIASVVNDRVTVAVTYFSRKIACPSARAPYLVSYEATVRGLKSGSNYEVVVGTGSTVLKHIQIP